LCALADNVDMVVVGPGVSLNEETQELVRRLVFRVTKPILVDGDGLTAIASDGAMVRRREAPVVLTPHAGEMSRLLGVSVAAVAHDRVAAVQDASRRLNAVVLLKGSSSLVAEPDGPVSINLSGNPGMATAGSGDVLAGTIAALHGLGLGLREAAEVGAFIHGLAGDLAAEARGQDGVVAGDIMEHLPRAMRLYRERFRELERNFCGRLVVI